MKITTYWNIERMWINLLTTLPKKRTEMQIIYSGIDGIEVQLCGSDYHVNPRLTGVSAERHWPGGGRITPPPQTNSQTNDRSETGEAALERSRRDGSKTLLKFFLKGHVSGQGQVKGKNWAFQHFGSQNRQLDLNRPKLGRNTLKC